MDFDEILHHVGDSGRFQICMIILLNILSLVLSPHDVLENFTAAIPAHHCSINLDNSRSEVSTDMNLTTEDLMKVSIPMGPNQKPEQCRRFSFGRSISPVAPHNHSTQWTVQQYWPGCTWGTSLCDFGLALTSTCICLALLHLFCFVLDLRSKLKKDVNSTGKLFRIKDIFINPLIRKIVLSNSSLLFAELFSFVGLLLDVQLLGKNMFLTQIFLGAIDVPSKSLTYFTIRNVSRRPLIAFLLLTTGSCITITIFISEEMYVLRTIIFILGKGCFAAFTCISTTYINELSPVELRSTLNGVFLAVVRLAGVLSALTLATRKYFVYLPMILYGVLPIVATISILFLPETFNLPHTDIIKDMEKRKRLMSKNISKKEGQDFLETTEC